MQTIFCTECGHKMVYAGAKPKFCSSCGVSMEGDSRPAPEAPEKGKRKLPSFRDQMQGRVQGGGNIGDDETDINYVPQLDGLQYEISSEGFGNPVYKFEDVVDVSTEEKPEEKPKKRSGRSKKERQ